MNWKNWIKLTIYIVDTGHWKGFSGNDKCSKKRGVISSFKSRVNKNKNLYNWF